MDAKIISDLIGERVTATRRGEFSEVIVGTVRVVALGDDAVVNLLLQTESARACFDEPTARELATVNTRYWRIVVEPRT